MRSGSRIWVVAQRNLRQLVGSLSPYAILSVGIAGVVLSLGNTLQVIQRGYAVVLREPFSLPILGVCVVAGLLLGLLAAISVARERESGILESLFHSPLKDSEYILGKFLAHWLMYAGMMLVLIVVIWVLALTTQLRFSPQLLFVPLFSTLLSATAIALGLLLATANRSLRGTLLSFLGFFLFFAVLSTAQLVLTSMVRSDEMLDLVALRDGVALANGLLRWFSPLSYFLDGSEALLRQDLWSWVGFTGFALLFTTVMLTGAIRLQRKTGVLA